MNVNIPASVITAIENIAIAGLSAGLAYLSTNAATLGAWGPLLAVAANVLLQGLNSVIKKPVSTFAIKKLSKED